MKPDEFEAILAKFSLLPEQLAALAGRHKRTIYRYRSGEMPIPKEFAAWLRSIEKVTPAAAGTFNVRFKPLPTSSAEILKAADSVKKVDFTVVLRPGADAAQRLRDRIEAMKKKPYPPNAVEG